LDKPELGLRIGVEPVDRHQRWDAELAQVFDVALEIGQARLSAVKFSRASASFATPPCILSARTVATTTAAAGLRPACRHLMSKNFSAPRSAPKPASVTV
jgi:hypothetical protein